MVAIDIITVGNEVLIGDVLDTNSHWLARQLTHLGGFVNRVVMVRDDVDAIVRELRSSLSRKADLVFISGGLGPTEDDRTLEGVAAALAVPRTRHDLALEQVRERYEFFARQGFVRDAALTQEREKMALLPEGGVPLSNPVGAAPGVLLQAGGSRIICLPGVPEELRGIFETSLRPVLVESIGKGAFVERVGRIDCGDESVLAPLLREVAGTHPGVYVKSRPRRFGRDVKIQVTLSATGASREDAAKLVEDGWRGLTRSLEHAGLRVETEGEG